MEQGILKIHLFKNSHDSFIKMLNEKSIPYEKLTPPVGVPMAAALEVAIALAPAIIQALAAVIVAWLEMNKSREVIFQDESYKPKAVRGYSQKDVEKIIATCRSATVIDPDGNK